LAAERGIAWRAADSLALKARWRQPEDQILEHLSHFVHPGAAPGDNGVVSEPMEAALVLEPPPPQQLSCSLLNSEGSGGDHDFKRA
jgi:hypothetical protein